MSALALRLEDFGRRAPAAPVFTQTDIDRARAEGRAAGAAEAEDHARAEFAQAIRAALNEAEDRAQIAAEARRAAVADLTRLADAVLAAALPELQNRLTARLIKAELTRLTREEGAAQICQITAPAALLPELAGYAGPAVQLAEGPPAIRFGTGRLEIDAAAFCAGVSSLLNQLIDRSEAHGRD